MTAIAAARNPLLPVAISSVAAGAALALALSLTRAGEHDALGTDSAAHATPERVAESFIHAYLAEDYARAVTFATPAFAHDVRARHKHERQTQAIADRSWVLQESHVLRADKLRFLGVLVTDDQDESTGWPVTLTLLRRDGHYRVDELHWPKGPPTAGER